VLSMSTHPTDNLLLSSLLADLISPAASVSVLPPEGDFEEFEPTPAQQHARDAALAFIKADPLFVTLLATAVESVCTAIER
jgi:hypothetical protein